MLKSDTAKNVNTEKMFIERKTDGDGLIPFPGPPGKKNILTISISQFLFA